MPATEYPGIRIAEHGVLGEARARALLAERFWILDRSVDVDGADMLIQRRLTSLHDREPPRFGVVQVKFLQDARSTAYVQSTYVTKDREPLREFFLLVHTGMGDAAASYLLTAQEILDAFKVAEAGHSQAGKHIMPGRELLAQRYQITSVTRALDAIEQSLRLADIERNRQLLFRTPFVRSPSRDHIEPEFIVPLDNWWGDIPEGFHALKERAQSALHYVDDCAEELRAIINSSDPRDALAKAEALDVDIGKGGLYVGGERIYDEELHLVVRQHANRYENLRDDGVLDAFLRLRPGIVERIADGLLPLLPVGSDDIYAIDVRIDEKTWLISSFSGELRPLPEEWRKQRRPPFSLHIPSDQLLSSEPGRVRYLWLLGGEGLDRPLESPRETVAQRATDVGRTIADAIYESRYPA